jgi:Phage tail lysozyme
MSKFDMPPSSAGWPVRAGWLVMAFTRDLNLGEAFRAGGIVGNMGFESGRLKQLREIGQPDGSGGYGWGQWTASRRVTFLRYASDNNLDWRSDEANYGYALAELSGTIPGANYRHVVQALMQTTTLEDAVFSVGETYERPGGTTADNLPGEDSRDICGREAMAGYAGLMAAVPLSATPDIPPVKPAVVHATLGTADVLAATVRLLQTAMSIAAYYDGPIDGHPNAALAAAMDKYNAWLDRPVA